MATDFFPVQTGHGQLRRLVLLRTIFVAAQIAAIAMVYHFLSDEVEWAAMAITTGVLASLNLLTWWRLHKAHPVSNIELFAQLCADVLALSVLLYFSGGSTNPFVSLFLLPLVIAAATLPQPYAWAMAAITTACYTLLMKFYTPLPANHAGHTVNEILQDDAFTLHVLGMWLGFVISACVVAYFAVRMAQAVRSRDESLAHAREETLRNERIIALGTQAATAAHELGTPLSTLAVVINEMKHEPSASSGWRDSIAMLDNQVQVCKRILNKLLRNAFATEGVLLLPVQDFLGMTMDEWKLLRPEIPSRYSESTTQPVQQLFVDASLRAALLNLLNNAADASPGGIDIEAGWDHTNFTLRIMDHGPGLTPDAVTHAGSAYFTTKIEGRGLGLFLANATIERMGGKVRLFNRDGGGATTEVVLPLGSGAP